MPEPNPQNIESESGKCLQCGCKTNNPRFCGRSCAAKYNNHVSPKRSPEGKCKGCDASIPTNKSYCKNCLQTKQIETEKERKKPQVFVNQETVFTCLRTSIDKHETVGYFLDVFEKVTEQEPAYLFTEDWQRHFDYLQHLKQFVCYAKGSYSEREKRHVVDFQAENLSYVLREWIKSVVYGSDLHPLASTFVLDTANVIAAHAYGIHNYHHGDGSFRIEAMLEGSDQFGAIVDQKIKKEITERSIRGLHVVANFPAGFRASIMGTEIDLSSRGVCFLPARCHESSSFNEGSQITIRTENPLQWDLSADFEFPGAFLIQCSEDMSRNEFEWWKFKPAFCAPGASDGVVVTGYLPVRWITHCGYENFQIEAMTPMPKRWQ